MYRDTLNCEAVREELWPLDRPQPYSKEREAARMHLGHCAECRAFFSRDALLGRAIAQHGSAGRAPERLRQRISGAVANEAIGLVGNRVPEAPGRERGAYLLAQLTGEILRATRLPARLRREGLAVAVAMMALLGAAAIVRPTGAEGFREAYASDYLNRAVQDHAIYSPDPATVSRFFLQEMGIGVQPVMLERGRVTRAMVCLLDDRQAAMVEYSVGDHVIAHYRVPNLGEAPEGEPSMAVSSKRGVSIVSWRDASFEHALVADLPTNELTALARTAFAGR